MGIYYRGISKRTKTIDGAEVHFSNFWGKAPSLFAENTGRWDAFCTRSYNTAQELYTEGEHRLVAMAQTTKELGEVETTPVAFWNGQSQLHDGFWDDNAVGRIAKVKGRYHIWFDEDKLEAYNQRMAA